LKNSNQWIRREDKTLKILKQKENSIKQMLPELKKENAIICS
jgi:hypothetical protein